MKPEEYKVETLGRCMSGMRVTCPPYSFVKITHDKSNISTTGYGKNQIKARDMALKELEELVKIWEQN
jgi:hypothetical protein